MGKESKEIKDVSDLPGVGDKIAEKLISKGYIGLMSIASSSPKELEADAEIGELTSKKIIDKAAEILGIGFEKASDILERRQQIKKISTGSANLNNLLGGGIETQSVTEMFGQFGSGKTQIGFQLAINVQLPIERGGLNGSCIYLDAENTFRPERVAQLAEAIGLDSKKVLENIYVARCFTTYQQTSLAEGAWKLIKEKNVKLLIVDSVTSNFRAEYYGRGELATRQQNLNIHLRTLQKLAEVFNVAVYITNQVMSRPDILFGDPTVPIGGHILGHFSTHRLYLRKSKGDTRIARMVDSPNLPEGEIIFRITPEGIKDPEEK
jgi:DNA repair protein RadA